MVMTYDTKKITFAWWNTSLSPHSKKNTASDEHKSYVIYTLLRLINDKSVDVLCLCEVSSEDVNFIAEVLAGTIFSIYDGTLRKGRKKFDICVIYKSQLLELIDSGIISKNHTKGELNAGQVVNFLIRETSEPITLYLVHWPSRIYDHEDSPKKILLGSLLREAVLSSIENRGIGNIIILGDFNEEPFNKSITDALGASRDITLVKKEPKLLYNPFWRHMTRNTLHPQSQEYDGCGTYYYKNDESNKWKTFDQIIFSSSFVRDGKWFLNEEKTEVFYDDDFIKFIFSSKSKFDHLPIISSIERA
ncbi:endonuclease/exonuclease/phosphatase family protein [Serratia sp. PAMC26656]|uniref:endonuclease/exonuclease/phosphatase family protein n=1 Tax=Serratia sp. PAMC26656 TaxID=2775909 RepID=UPI0018F69CC5|nr:endonuclease/exonuclease/phosphatase family protein [Serratia sp. PAMC26656]MBJ7892379.1 endonuclease/exonuclease/phosphatase family protein [Serratia sp. PAMC26656]